MQEKVNCPFGNTEDVPGYVRRLRRLRTDAGLTQQQVAVQIGSSRSNYIRYECGRTDLPVRHLVSLCRLYGVSSDHVLGLGTAVPEAAAGPAKDVSQFRAADQPRLGNLNREMLRKG